MMSKKTPNSKRTSLRQAIRQFLIGEDGASGASLVEFTLFAPILVIMSIYMVDFGLLFFRNMEVQNAAQAGVDWAVANRDYNSADISAAVTNSTNYKAVNVSSGYPKEQCGCPSNSPTTFTTYTNACTCSGGSNGGVYVTVKTQATYNSFIPYGLISKTYTLTAQSMARIK
jgi:Flp pilus assembly protein TadG